MTRAAAVLLLVAVAVAPTLAQDLAPKAGPQKVRIAILNGEVHPVSGPVLKPGYVVFENGKITDIGAGKMEIGPNTEVIDARGKRVYPGFVAPKSNLGLTEIGSVRATRDFEEVGPVKPEVRAATALNPDSTLIPVARSNGVLSAGIFPQGGAIPGRISVIRLTGWTNDDMTVLDDAGLAVAWPSTRTVRAWWMEKSEEQQKKENARNLALIRETFAKAFAYRTARAADPALPVDLRLASMGAVLPRKDGPPALPVFFHAGSRDQIHGAVEFAVSRGLRPVIVGGRDADLCLPLLKRHDVPVILGGTFRMPRRRDSDYDEAFRLPSVLAEAGIRFCLTSSQGASNERNLPYSAGLAVAHGLGRDAAIRAITLSAAEILGVADHLGSLEKGKAATLIVTDGDPLEIPTNVEIAFIDGRRVDLRNKQTALYEKYREKYRQLGLIPR